ncbi:hypothetical protein RFI_00021 [Reticulomyxa filosa]|uniref:Uncharacterized protein n=1 Tax=Reticulomyxa filosa TaxID=46433 RepID=X6PFP2_RETFI|nr:hypothetical protein RFI_00021 [Reticulomyxa filosa]|eukprot:ETO37041.1 hypothetical protein RFI_00021 [Reticulomyxa filosa]
MNCKRRHKKKKKNLTMHGYEYIDFRTETETKDKKQQSLPQVPFVASTPDHSSEKHPPLPLLPPQSRLSQTTVPPRSRHMTEISSSAFYNHYKPSPKNKPLPKPNRQHASSVKKPHERDHVRTQKNHNTNRNIIVILTVLVMVLMMVLLMVMVMIMLTMIQTVKVMEEITSMVPQAKLKKLKGNLIPFYKEIIIVQKIEKTQNFLQINFFWNNYNAFFLNENVYLLRYLTNILFHQKKYLRTHFRKI